MTVKEHLQKLHEESAAHHQVAAKGHRTLAKLFKAESGLESAADIAAAHEGLAKCHDDAASDHSDMLKAVRDSMAKADLDRIVPDRVSGIIREFPPTPIPRHGAPDMSKASRVPEEFAHLVEIQED